MFWILLSVRIVCCNPAGCYLFVFSFVFWYVDCNVEMKEQFVVRMSVLGSCSFHSLKHVKLN